MPRRALSRLGVMLSAPNRAKDALSNPSPSHWPLLQVGVLSMPTFFLGKARDILGP